MSPITIFIYLSSLKYFRHSLIFITLFNYNLQLRDCELGAIVNRDLSKRIRSVNGITCHRQVARNDMKLCANIINNFDNRSGLWQSADDEQPAKENTYGVVSRNPVLHNITDFLIEEASAEEEELLGENATCEPEDNTEKDALLFKVRLSLF